MEPARVLEIASKMMQEWCAFIIKTPFCTQEELKEATRRLPHLRLVPPEVDRMFATYEADYDPGVSDSLSIDDCFTLCVLDDETSSSFIETEPVDPTMAEQFIEDWEAARVALLRGMEVDDEVLEARSA